MITTFRQAPDTSETAATRITSAKTTTATTTTTVSNKRHSPSARARADSPNASALLLADSNARADSVAELHPDYYSPRAPAIAGHPALKIE